MKYHVKTSLELLDDDFVIVDLLLYGEVIRFEIEKSKIKGYEDRYTFIRTDNGKEYFGGGCKYRSKQESLDYIDTNHREQLRNDLNPFLSVNGKEVKLYLTLENIN